MATQKELNHLEALHHKHEELAEEINQAYAHYADDLEVVDLKKRKLRAKEDYLSYQDRLDHSGYGEEYA